MLDSRPVYIPECSARVSALDVDLTQFFRDVIEITSRDIWLTTHSQGCISRTQNQCGFPACGRRTQYSHVWQAISHS